ncbi:MAG: hypothetical protein KJ726_02495 [Verrucomicrobia bacterium]|nr:hypothetical protein [Verrucomicrobiota bacterium]MBU1908897.1 hypothetical protein [Verrucomicrobiota bacterium]
MEPATAPSTDLKAGRGRQAELWEEPATTAVLTERERPAEEESVPVSLHVGAVEKRHTVLGAAVAGKGRTMTPLGIARFLRIGGSVYDGRDEGRWFALPARKKTVPFQLMRNLAVSADDRRAWMSSERIGSRRSDGL